MAKRLIEFRISIHALLAESDCAFIGVLSRAHKNFYPRSPCGERHLQRQLYEANSYISIHALLAESDELDKLAYNPPFISIHALLAESDYQGQAGFRRLSPFLSTLSLRRATAVNMP